MRMIKNNIPSKDASENTQAYNSQVIVEAPDICFTILDGIDSKKKDVLIKKDSKDNKKEKTAYLIQGGWINPDYSILSFVLFGSTLSAQIRTEKISTEIAMQKYQRYVDIVTDYIDPKYLAVVEEYIVNYTPERLVQLKRDNTVKRDGEESKLLQPVPQA